jgi:hypothetical protein
MVIDPNRKTAMGKDYIVNPKSEHGPEVERLPGNCHRSTEFAIARQKGLTWASETATANPICQSCVFFGTCGDPAAVHLPGSGFRALRSEALKASRIRMSPDQYPHNWDSDRTIAIWDEAAQTIAVSESLVVTIADFDGAWATLEQEEPELHHHLATVRGELRRLLTGKQPHHGFSREEIVAAIGRENDLALTEIERIRDATAPNLADLFGQLDGVDTTELSRQISSLRAKIDRKTTKTESLQCELVELEDRLKQRSPGVLFGGADENTVKLEAEDLRVQINAFLAETKLLRTDLSELETERASLRAVSRKVQASDRRKQTESLENTCVCWLSPFFEIVSGARTGTISIQHGKLYLHLLKEQHRRIIHEVFANIFLDATATAASISFRSGIPAEKILICEAVHESNADVFHVQVSDFGLAGKNRAQSTDERIVAAIAGIVAQHEECNPVVFDHLSKAGKTGAQGIHFRDSRGENSFTCNDIFIHVGIPLPNIGAVRIEHEILCQQCTQAASFDEYYQSVCDAELFQERGRDRALRRGGAIFHYWLTDLELPFTATQTKAAELSPDAASQSDKTRAALVQAIAQLANCGEKITQSAIAQVAEVTQGWVSQFFASLGGWKMWREIITGLLKGSNTTSNNLESALESLHEEAQWIAQTWLKELVDAFEENPLGVVEAVGAIVYSYGFAGWERILAAGDRGVVARLLGQISLLAPQWAVEGYLQSVLPGNDNRVLSSLDC